MEAILEKNLKDFQVSWPHVRKPRPNTQYSLIVPELPEFNPNYPNLRYTIPSLDSVWLPKISLGNSGNTLLYPKYSNYPKFAFVFVFIHVLLVEHLTLSLYYNIILLIWTSGYNIPFLKFNTNYWWFFKNYT
jgi:hypothetical protein